MGIQPQPGQTAEYPSEVREAAAGYDEPPSKRHRPAIDSARRTAYVQEERPAQRSYAQQRDPYAQYREPTPTQRQSYYVQQPSSAQSSEFPLPGHQRTLSSSASSPFESPRTEYPTYGYSNQPPMYQQPRDTGYQYQYRPPPQMPQTVPPERQLPSSIPSQQLSQFSRPEDQQYADMRYQSQRQPQSYQPQQPAYPSTQQPLPRTLPPPPQGAPASALPPLGSNFPQAQYATTNGSGPETYSTTLGGQGFASHAYRGREG